MIHKKYFMLFCLSVIFLFSVHAQKSYVKPGSAEFVAVFSFDVLPNPENEFFKSYSGLKNSDGSAANSYKGDVGKIQYRLLTSQKGLFNEDIIVSIHSDVFKPDMDLLSIRVPLKNNAVEFLGLKMTLYNINSLYFMLPFVFKLNVPRGIKYVYLGHFEFRRKGGTDYSIIDVKNVDRFDEAKKIIQERYGDAAELVRLPVNLPNFDDN